jgi:hypothetical protein
MPIFWWGKFEFKPNIPELGARWLGWEAALGRREGDVISYGGFFLVEPMASQMV